MNIVDGGKLEEFSERPTELPYYFAMIGYKQAGWAVGPGFWDKEALYRALIAYSSATEIRIYTILLPTQI